MSLLNFFKGNSNKVTTPQIDAAVEKALMEALQRHDVNAVKKIYVTHGLTANTPLRNGETLLTCLMKKQIENYQHYDRVCANFQKNDNGLHQKIETIEALRKNHPMDQKAVFHLSSDALLKRLHIPQEQWPEWHMGQEPLKAWQDHNAALQEAGNRCTDFYNGILNLVESSAPDAAPNAQGETVAQLRTKLNKEHESPAIARTNKCCALANQFYTETTKPVSLNQFNDFANNNALKNSFAWLPQYQPSEQEFLDTFDPDWLKKKMEKEARLQAFKNKKSDNNTANGMQGLELTPGYASTQKPEDNKPEEKKEEPQQTRVDPLVEQQNELFRQQVVHLHDTGFYKWRSHTAESAPVIEQQKQTIEQQKAEAREKLTQQFQQSREQRLTYGLSM